MLCHDQPACVMLYCFFDFTSFSYSHHIPCNLNNSECAMATEFKINCHTNWSNVAILPTQEWSTSLIKQGYVSLDEYRRSACLASVFNRRSSCCCWVGYYF